MENSPAPSSARTLSSSSSGSSPAALETGLDAQRLHALCARSVEQVLPPDQAPAALRPFLELLRRLLQARAVAWLEEPSQRGRWPDTAVSARPGGGAALIALRNTLDVRRAAAGTRSGEEGYTLSVPVSQEGEHRGWLVAQLLVSQPRDLQAMLVLLQMASGFLLYHEQRRVTELLGGVLERASGLLEIFRSSGSELDFELACRRAVDGLRDELGCARVSLALARWGRWRLQAVSGLVHLDWKSAAHRPAEAAMREAARAGKPLDWSPDSPSLPETAAHELLGQQTGAARLLTLPLPRAAGALLLEWAPQTAGSTDEVPAARDPRVATAAAHFVPALFELLRRARPHPVAFSVRHWWSGVQRRRRGWILAGLGTAALVLACPVHYTIRAECRLVPVVKQVIAAPFAGQLRHSLVRPGDLVKEGDALGEMDSRELKMKESELTAAQSRALKQRDRSMANQGEGSDFAAGQVANFEAQSVAEELALVRRKLSLLTVRSPLAGTVVSGDLRRAEGQPIQQGQILWEVAPLDRMIAELEVPDREISRVRAGQPVQIRLEAFAAGTWESSIERVHPQSEAADARNVFICEAPVTDASGRSGLRPGMRGRVAIETDRHPLLWNLGHRLWEWLGTTLFW